MIRIWEEISKIFLDFLQSSPNSPFKKVGSIFARKEYQSLSGNLSHTHLIAEILYHLLTEAELSINYYVHLSLMWLDMMKLMIT